MSNFSVKQLAVNRSVDAIKKVCFFLAVPCTRSHLAHA